ncbi:unnamed protein product [Lampetra fluviatilis]
MGRGAPCARRVTSQREAADRAAAGSACRTRWRETRGGGIWRSRGNGSLAGPAHILSPFALAELICHSYASKQSWTAPLIPNTDVSPWQRQEVGGGAVGRSVLENDGCEVTTARVWDERGQARFKVAPLSTGIGEASRAKGQRRSSRRAGFKGHAEKMAPRKQISQLHVTEQ